MQRSSTCCARGDSPPLAGNAWWDASSTSRGGCHGHAQGSLSINLNHGVRQHLALMLDERVHAPARAPVSSLAETRVISRCAQAKRGWRSPASEKGPQTNVECCHLSPCGVPRKMAEEGALESLPLNHGPLTTQLQTRTNPQRPQLCICPSSDQLCQLLCAHVSTHTHPINTFAAAFRALLDKSCKRCGLGATPPAAPCPPSPHRGYASHQST